MVFALLGAITGAAWLFVRGGASSGHDAPYIVLISIDTCRADRLSCYGFPHPTTPNLDALAREGFLFRDVIAPATMTLPSHASMLTGTIPPYHGIHSNATYRLRESDLTLAEILKDKGYATAAMVGAFVLDSRFGLAQGFDLYDDRIEVEEGAMHALNSRTAGDVSLAAKAWLQGGPPSRGEPFFLFLHYYDPHFPYNPPEPFATTYAKIPYAGEIAYVDKEIGDIIGELKRLGIYERALIIVTADHGEARGEHGEPSHGYFMYRSTTWVPLIIKLPKQREARVVDQKIGLVDLVPTILEYLGLPIPAHVQGRSFAPVLVGGEAEGEERYVYSEALMGTQFGCSPLVGVETSTWKYIHTSRPELYYLAKDPKELVNLVQTDPRRVGMMKGRLEQILEEHTRVATQGAAAALDQQARDRVAALGYVETGGALSLELDTNKEDPKDFLPFFIRLNIANAHISHAPREGVKIPRPGGGMLTGSSYQVARQLCEEILVERPNLAGAHLILGMIAEREGRSSDAETHYRRGVEVAPDNAKLCQGLGNVLAQQQQWEEALVWLRKTLEVARGHTDQESRALDAMLNSTMVNDALVIDVGLAVGEVLVKLERYEEAATMYGELREMQGLTAGWEEWATIKARIGFQLGETLMKLDRVDDAIDSFEQALELNPEHRQAREALELAKAVKQGAPSP